MTPHLAIIKQIFTIWGSVLAEIKNKLKIFQSFQEFSLVSMLWFLFSLFRGMRNDNNGSLLVMNDIYFLFGVIQGKKSIFLI